MRGTSTRVSVNAHAPVPHTNAHANGNEPRACTRCTPTPTPGCGPAAAEKPETEPTGLTSDSFDDTFFDALVSVKTLQLRQHYLTKIPKMRNMRSLESLLVHPCMSSCQRCCLWCPARHAHACARAAAGAQCHPDPLSLWGMRLDCARPALQVVYQQQNHKNRTGRFQGPGQPG